MAKKIYRLDDEVVESGVEHAHGGALVVGLARAAEEGHAFDAPVALELELDVVVDEHVVEGDEEGGPHEEDGEGDDPVATIKAQVRRAIQAMASHEDTAGLLAEHEASGSLEELRQDVATLSGLVSKQEAGASGSGGGRSSKPERRAN